MIKITNYQEKGAALLLSTILILSVSLIISLGLSSLTFHSLISARNKIKSIQSYYAAEAGIEDSLLRIKDEMRLSSPNTLIIGDSSTSIEISEELIGNAWDITCQGDTDNRIRKLTVTYSKVTSEVSFYYGAQAGEGGVVMGNNAQVIGNLFSNGSVLPSGGGGEVTNTAVVSLNGNKIEKTDVGGDAYAYSCENSDITGTLYYVTGGTITDCDYGSLVELTNEIEAEDLPIPPEQITDWKDEAVAGGTFSGDYILDGGETVSLGPIKIIGNMIIDNNSFLIVTGMIHVTGNITIENGATARLDDGFGLLSGLIIGDGKIIIRNNGIIQGSGEEGSFLMLLSTNNSVDPTSPAVDVGNNAQGAIFYASNGLIRLRNNIDIGEATGYKLILDNNAIVRYEAGLENINFTSGPGGSWRIQNWQEIE